MTIIDQIAIEYPQLDLEAIRILLLIYKYPGYCVREVADILGMDPKAVQLRITLMAQGLKENPRHRNTPNSNVAERFRPGQHRRSSSKLELINCDYKMSDRRKRDLMLTAAGESLAEKLKPLTQEYNNE